MLLKTHLNRCEKKVEAHQISSVVERCKFQLAVGAAKKTDPNVLEKDIIDLLKESSFVKFKHDTVKKWLTTKALRSTINFLIKKRSARGEGGGAHTALYPQGGDKNSRAFSEKFESFRRPKDARGQTVSLGETSTKTVQVCHSTVLVFGFSLLRGTGGRCGGYLCRPRRVSPQLPGRDHC